MNNTDPEIISGRRHHPFLGKTDNGHLLFQDHAKQTKYMLCAFAGQSMLPSLVDGDLLELVDHDSQPVKIGDIICFRTPESNSLIVHRVCKVDTDGLRTRGDNNALDDEWQVHPSEIVGKVVAYRRGTRRFEITNGRTGILPMQWHRLIRRLTGRLKREMSKRLPAGVPAYPLVRYLPAGLRPRFVVFNNRTLLFLANRRIGEFDAGRKQWLILGWHRFFIDTAKLPSPAEISSIRD